MRPLSSRKREENLLRRVFGADEARRQLEIGIDWGRYAELFEYHAEGCELTLGVTTQTAPVA